MRSRALLAAARSLAATTRRHAVEGVRCASSPGIDAPRGALHRASAPTFVHPPDPQPDPLSTFQDRVVATVGDGVSPCRVSSFRFVEPRWDRHERRRARGRAGGGRGGDRRESPERGIPIIPTDDRRHHPHRRVRRQVAPTRRRGRVHVRVARRRGRRRVQRVPVHLLPGRVARAQGQGV